MRDRRRAARGALLASIALAPAPAVAADALHAAVESIEGADWRVSGLEAALDLTAEPLRGEVRIALIELPDAGLSFAGTRVVCGQIDLSLVQFACRDAAVTLELPQSGRQTFPGELVYSRRTGALRFALRNMPVAGGRLNLSGDATENTVEVEFGGTGLQLGTLSALAATFAPAVEPLDPSGSVDVEGSLRTHGGVVSRLILDGDFSKASASNEAGTMVAASADAAIEVHATREGNGWRFDMALTADAGEAYVEPVYANLSSTPLEISVQGEASAGFTELALAAVSLRQGTLVAATGSLDVRLPSGDDGEVLVSGTLQLENASVDALYSGLLQVLAAGTPFGDLETAGTVSGTVSLADSALAGVDLVLDDVIADDGQGRFSVHALDGEVHWPGPGDAPGDTPPTHVRWAAASAYSIPFAGGGLSLRLGGNDVELLEPLVVQTMGGAVRVNRLAVTNFGEADASGLLDAELEPIELGQLTAAFGWPAFSGTLSGRLPLLRYDGGILTLGGALTARAFDGDIRIADLRLEEPFGLVPRLSGDLHLRGLDLELVTNTFSFGLIQGRLSGDVTGLKLEGWRPVTMDLHLYTPPGDDSRRRISQRAIENLASVGGGGAAAALSSGFMKLFEVFAYDEIGIRCVLEDGICAMSGTGPAGRDELGGGYYIVRGSGLPRIDVVGYRSRVSWSRLVRQLENILQTGTPVVNTNPKGGAPE